MPAQERSFDWRVLAIWAVLLAASALVHAYVEVASHARIGQPVAFGRVLIVEACSHLVVGALLPAIYWMHRRWPISRQPRNLIFHVLGVVPYSIAHTVGMAALRFVWFSGIAGEAYSFPLTVDRLTYEFAKDIFSYGLLSAATVALRMLLQRLPEPVEAVVATSGPLPERFAVRKRGGAEIMVEVADIDRVEASGNYAVLHVGGETFEIRSSLSRLECELDSKRFLRVHKSHLVNVARVVEVTPWVSGDWRIRLKDGSEVNLSRRYRQRFEAVVPVKS
ncbi:MAG: LytTR family transcriptional regulator [Alphaproteobacteria bacterium]|nr:LytTR family transcriptional regulator [Alphaproteobacteria bacterium]